MSTHILKVGRNKEGHALAYLNPKDSDSGLRIAGPKAWGGFSEKYSLEISDESLIEYINGYAPNVLNNLIAEETKKTKATKKPTRLRKTKEVRTIETAHALNAFVDELCL